MSVSSFHPVISKWFSIRFGRPTDAQRFGWPSILQDQDTLIAAPTGSGKTLAAFLACLDRLIREGLKGPLPDEARVLYVSPLKALSNDIQRNLASPLKELETLALQEGVSLPRIRVLVRTGDTPASERRAMIRRPPHIVVTTPESFYLLLTAESSRKMLGSVETVIVDEIHAMARDKRGSHLALSLERLEHLCKKRPVRIGLSATQRPIEEMAKLLVGTRRIDAEGRATCEVVDVGHLRLLDLSVETPRSPLSAVCSNEQWKEVYERISGLIRNHRSTLIFVNTRRLAERVTHQLCEILGENAVASHHGSLSKKIRLRAEERLKSGELRAIVATASLELGIDIGFIDLVIQIGSPRSIATFLQRIGRSGHALGRIPKGRLFALTRDELLECAALIRAVRARRLDRVQMPKAPLDILAQQVVAAAACEEWNEDALFEMVTSAYPYRDLSPADYEAVLTLLSEGFSRGSGRRSAYLYWDRLHRRVKGRPGARLAAITSGGAIPERADYKVVAEPDRVVVGAVDEDFAVESLSGDIFLLGNTSWRIRHVRGGEVVVTDAHGAPPTIPFWRGEAPSRTIELSQELSTLRAELDRRLGNPSEAAAFLAESGGIAEEKSAEIIEYVAAQKGSVGMVPTQNHLLIERFLDESGGMQLVIHAPFGGRVNRAYGLALRKRFCRRFDFELQASAEDNGIVLSLGPQQSFLLEEVVRMIRPDAAEALLVQALLGSPIFITRWRWNATRALAVLRQRSGKKVPPALQRFRADDLLSSIFPALTACPDAGNVPANLSVPDHPLVKQTVNDALHEAMDLEGWTALLRQIEAGTVRVSCVDTREPTPFAYQLLNAEPYAFLDDAPLEERRARAVATRRTLTVESLRDLGRLDPEAIDRVRREAWPVVRDADELHDTLLSVGLLPEQEGEPWRVWFKELVDSGRAGTAGDREGRLFWIALDRRPWVAAALPDLRLDPILFAAPGPGEELSAAEGGIALVRGRLEVTGPVSAEALSRTLGLSTGQIEAALLALEAEGQVLRGRFTPAAVEGAGYEWCARRLLARIHRLTLDRLRRQMEPVSTEVLLHFLLGWSRVLPGKRVEGKEGLLAVIEQLQGFEVPAAAWERDILPARVMGYDPKWLDELCFSGEVVWGRIRRERARGAHRNIGISLMLREDLAPLRLPLRPLPELLPQGDAGQVIAVLSRYGALFFHEIVQKSGLLPAQVEAALWELVAAGLLSGDGFGSIRSLTTSVRRDADRLRRRLKLRGRSVRSSRGGNGRWWILSPLEEGDAAGATERRDAALEFWCRQLLERYGVVFRDLLAREEAAPPWRELLPIYRKLESRGEIRGGRFVTGVGGEQFLLPEVVDLLRQDPEKSSGKAQVISAADPMNLVGILVGGSKVPATASNTVAFSAGRHAGHRQGGEVWINPDLDLESACALERELRSGRRDPPPEGLPLGRGSGPFQAPSGGSSPTDVSQS